MRYVEGQNSKTTDQIFTGTVFIVLNHANRPKNERWCCNFLTWFIFNLQRRKICSVLFNNIQQKVFMCGVFKCEKSLAVGGGHQFKVRTSLHPGPKLISTALFPTRRWPHTFPKPAPFQSHIPTNATQFY